MKKFRVQRHAHALDLSVTVLLNQHVNPELAPSPKIDPEHKGDSDIDVTALTTPGITQDAIKWR